MTDEEAACSSTMKLHAPKLHELLFYYCHNCFIIWPCEPYTRAVTVLSALDQLGQTS